MPAASQAGLPLTNPALALAEQVAGSAAVPRAHMSLTEQALTLAKQEASATGGAGFDPAGLGRSVQSARRRRSAGLMHGRFALRAALGWPPATGGAGPSGTGGPALASFLFADVFWVAYVIKYRCVVSAGAGLVGFVPPTSGLLPGGPWLEGVEVRHCRLTLAALAAIVIEEAASRAPTGPMVVAATRHSLLMVDAAAIQCHLADATTGCIRGLARTAGLQSTGSRGDTTRAYALALASHQTRA